MCTWTEVRPSQNNCGGHIVQDTQGVQSLTSATQTHNILPTPWRRFCATTEYRVTNRSVPPLLRTSIPPYPHSMLETFILYNLSSDIHVSYSWMSHCPRALDMALLSESSFRFKMENKPSHTPRDTSLSRTLYYLLKHGHQVNWCRPPVVSPRTLTGKGLDRECCGEDLATGGTLLPGLVPGPLPPANWAHKQIWSSGIPQRYYN